MSSVDYLNSISENATRLRMRVQESLSEHTREISAGRMSSAYFDSTEDKLKNLRKQLDSNSDREKLDAMKRLIALISKGRNVSEYFAQVVKNVASSSLEIRKLVYIYLLRYAEQEPDLALLSINTFQKDLSDSNPLIRAMALRVLSGIRVPMIGNVVLMAIKKCSTDVSPYVRKVAALATCKAYDLDNSHLPSLVEIISNLLRDRSPLSIGSVAIAFEYVCPTRLDLLHQHYRRLCRIAVDVDEWGQVDLLGLLLRYTRTMLPRPVQLSTGEDVSPDVKLLLDSTEPLFQNRNPAVVLAVTRVFWYAGLPTDHSKFVSPLLHLLLISKEVERVALAYLLVIARKSSTLFANSYSRFFIFSEDLVVVKRMKIAMLLRLVNLENHQAILRELIDYADDPSDEVVSDSITAIGRCAAMIPECTQQCLTALISMIKSNHDTLVSGAVLVLKTLVQRHLSSTTSSHPSSSKTSLDIVSQLAKKVDGIRHPSARACIVWLVGQYAASDEPGPGPKGIAQWAPDVLRKTAKSFGEEDTTVKLQIVILAAKLLVLCPDDVRLQMLSRYVFSLARYDLNYDVRDRARVIASLVKGLLPETYGQDDDEPDEDQGRVVLRREQIKVVLFEGKAPAADNDDSQTFSGITTSTLGSLGIVTGKSSVTETVLPDWLEQGVEASLRESPEDAMPPPTPVPLAISSQSAKAMSRSSPVVLTPTTGTSPSGSGVNSGAKGVWTDLDDFYADEENHEEEESEEEDEDEDGEETVSDEDGDEDGDEDEDEDGEEDESDAEVPSKGGSTKS